MRKAFSLSLPRLLHLTIIVHIHTFIPANRNTHTHSKNTMIRRVLLHFKVGLLYIINTKYYRGHSKFTKDNVPEATKNSTVGPPASTVSPHFPLDLSQ